MLLGEDTRLRWVIAIVTGLAVAGLQPLPVAGAQLVRVGESLSQPGILTFPLPNGHAAMSITTGPDNRFWFTELAGFIGNMTTDGSVTEFTVPTQDSGPYGITNGPDGNLWFTEWGADKIGYITPTGSITEFALPTSRSLKLARG